MGSDIQSNSIGILGTTDFNPRSPCGERLSCFYDDFQRKVFQSTLPVWGATCCMLRVFPGFPYFNPRSPCGERRRATAGGRRKGDFNPRSPCGERLCSCGERKEPDDISIHAPRVGSDGTILIGHKAQRGFQSTLPVWGATWIASTTPNRQRYFNPRSPCGERPSVGFGLLIWRLFQSTLPVWGATTPSKIPLSGNFKFQSTLPVWGATAEIPKDIPAKST